MSDLTIRRIQVIREATKKVTKILAGRDIEVTQRGTEAYVEHAGNGRVSRVNIPYIPDNASEELIAAIQGFLDHEVGHLLFSDFDLLYKGAKEGDFMKDIHNTIEDTLIERKMSQRFHGSGWNLDNVRRFYADKFAQKYFDEAIAEGASPSKMFGVLMVPAFRAWAGQQIFIDYMKDKWGHIQSTVDKLGTIPDDVKKCDTTLDTYNLAKEFLTALNHQEPPPPPQSQSPSQSENQKDGKDDDDSESSPSSCENSESSDDTQDEDSAQDQNNDKCEDEGDDEEDELNGSPSSDGEEDEGDEEGESNGSSSGDEEDEGDEGDSNDSAASGSNSSESEGEESDEGKESDGSTSGDSGPKDASDSSELKEDTEVDGDDLSGGGLSMEEMEEGVKGSDFDNNASLLISDLTQETTERSGYRVFSTEEDSLETFEPHKDLSSQIEQMMADVDHMTGRIQKDLERVIVAKSQSRWQMGHKRGRINNNALSKLAIGKQHPEISDSRVFKRKEEHTSKDIAVELLVDCSGSMRGHKITTAMQTAYAFSSVLERLSIPHEIIGFTTKAFSSDMYSALNRELVDRGMQYSRLEALSMPIFKAFSERQSLKVKARIASYGYAHTDHRMSYNVDGESIMIAAGRLAQRQEHGKLMIVLSDGNPAGGGPASGYNTNARDSIRTIEASSIDIVGIGIMSSAVKQYYTHNVVLNNISELPNTVMKELKQVILKAIH